MKKLSVSSPISHGSVRTQPTSSADIRLGYWMGIAKWALAPYPFLNNQGTMQNLPVTKPSFDIWVSASKGVTTSWRSCGVPTDALIKSHNLPVPGLW